MNIPLKINWLGECMMSVMFIIGLGAVGYIHSMQDALYWSLYRLIISILGQALLALHQEFKKSA